ncbi:MAG TPA: hypothetical protein VGO21_04925, partial [Candidatus Paceibacterota bacterium]|nr:hypothetical protein [Candidatus Paceibacterota bacterium]
MKKTLRLIKKSMSVFTVLALLMAASFIPATSAKAIMNWDATGSYMIAFNYLGTDYTHNASLAQNNSGNLTGTGGYPSTGVHTYDWQVTSGSVTGDAITFDAKYTAGADAVTPLTILHVTGTIAMDGGMSGTWSDNYKGGSREGTWKTTSGHAVHPVENPSKVKVTIVKYINGSLATASSANNKNFKMNATWSADNIGSGSGQFSLSLSGYNGDPTPYRAVTTDMSSGASYSTSEVMDNVVGANCDAGKPFALSGYTSGDTLAAAAAATLTASAPQLTNI